MKKQLRYVVKSIAMLLVLLISLGTLLSCKPDTPEEPPVDQPDPDTGKPDEDTEESPTETPTTPTEPAEEEWIAAITVAPIRAQELLLCDAFSGDNGITLGTLQGLAAKHSTTQILLRANAYDRYMPLIKRDGVTVKNTNPDGASWDMASLLSYYAPLLDGYILTSTESASVAISLAGVCNAVVVTASNEQLAKDAGLTMMMDVRDKDDGWLRKSEYFEQLSRTVAVEQPVSMAPKLVDYAVMCGAYFSFYSGNQESEHANMFDFLDDGAVVVGWNNTLGEYATVKSLSTVNACLIPADHAYNLSTLSSFAGSGVLNKRLYSKEDADIAHVEDTAVHTVCFVMSDGDNLQWTLNNYATAASWYGSTIRGSFPMNWGLPALVGDLALPMMEFFAQSQTSKDEFIMQLSGLGYTFPSLWEEDARWEMADKLAEVMESRGMRYMNILDDHGFTEENMDAFTGTDAIRGIFYTDYSNYAGYEGQILWVNEKPVVSARYRLWAKMEGSDMESIARQVNGAPANVYREDSYTFIIVHAWSGMDAAGNLVPDGNTMAAVEKLISMFDEHVQVVSASEFMNRLIENVAP